MAILRNYRQSLLLLFGILIGGMIGIFFPSASMYLKPLGELFLNVIFVLIVPLVFFSMSTAVAENKGMGRIRKIIGYTFLFFFLTTLIAVTLMYIVTLVYNPFQDVDLGQFIDTTKTTVQAESSQLGDVIVQTLTVSNFLDLFSKDHLLPLILFSLFLGLTISIVGQPAAPFLNGLKAANKVVTTMIHYVMKVAPIGLGSYFAYTLGKLGPQIIGGYLKALLLFIGCAVVYYIMILPLYAYFGGGLLGVKAYFANLIDPCLQALGTSSSAACIPVNLEALEKMGIPEDVRETVIALGANVHKDGSAMSGVLQVTLLFTLFNRELTTMSAAFSIILGGFLVGLVMGSIPSGGLTAELLLVSFFAFPVEVIPVIAVISTITDMFATVVNSGSNITCAMMVTKCIDKKNVLIHKGNTVEN